MKSLRQQKSNKYTSTPALEMQSTMTCELEHVLLSKLDRFDKEVESTRQEIEDIRVQREAARIQNEHDCTILERQIDGSRHRIQLLRKRNNLRMYCKIIEDLGCAPSIQRKQGMLLQAMHLSEVNSNFTQLIERQTDKMVQYMICEISVLEDECTDMEVQFLNKRNMVNNEKQQMQNEFSRSAEKQRMVLNKLQSLLQLPMHNGYITHTFTEMRPNLLSGIIDMEKSMDSKTLHTFRKQSSLDFQEGMLEQSSQDLKSGLSFLSDSLKKWLENIKALNNNPEADVQFMNVPATA